MAEVVDEVRGDRPDGVRPESEALRIGAQEEVDAGMPEFGVVLLGVLDVADDRAITLDDQRDVVVTRDEVAADALEVEHAPPRGDGRFGQDGCQGGRVSKGRRAQRDEAASEVHAASVASDRR